MERIVDYVLSQEFSDKLIKYSDVSTYKVLNLLCCYVELCVLILGAWFLVLILMMMITIFAEKILEILQKVILGKEHQRSMQYSAFQIWFLKVQADINVVLLWIRRDIFGVRYSGATNYSMVKRAKIFTVENIIGIIKVILKFFFEFSIIHILLALCAVYVFWGNMLRDVLYDFLAFISKNPFPVSNVIDYFELATICFLVVYIILDVKHKANGYFEIRTERFKELYKMEEKLLHILKNMNYKLANNIEVIVDRKPYILSNGAECLTGKACHIVGKKIIYVDQKSWNSCTSDGLYVQLRNLEEMSEEFQKLAKLEEEFKQSSLSYSNIFLIDHQAMLTRLANFYLLGHENPEYKKMEFFCRSSMKKWVENRFIKPIKDNEQRFFSEDDTRTEILDASAMLDNELRNAFELEIYLKKYEHKMIKRLKKINRFSRYNLN